MVIWFPHFDSGPYRGWDLRAGGSTGGIGLRLLSGPVQVSGASVAGPRPLVLLPHVQVPPILLLQKLCLHTLSLLVCLFCGILSSGACQSLVSLILISKEIYGKMRMILGVKLDENCIFLVGVVLSCLNPVEVASRLCQSLKISVTGLYMPLESCPNQLSIVSNELKPVGGLDKSCMLWLYSP